MKIRHTALLLWLTAGAAFANTTNELPKFDDVYQLLRAHLTGVSDSDLNRAAVEGLLSHFKSTAMLVGEPSSVGLPSSPALGKALIYDDSYAYLRVLKVETNLASELQASYRNLSKTNRVKIKGVILDLRFAGGSDFPAAASAADCFLNSDQPLLEFGNNILRSSKKDDAISVPLAVLINSSTTEAAEGLAAILRVTGSGLLLGSPTAGQASLFTDFPLADGAKLRIATGELKLGDGHVFAGAIKPDIAVNTTMADDKAYWEHPYQIPGSLGNTNLAGGAATNVTPPNGGVFRRFNEAELVREQRDGADLEADFGAATPPAADANVKILRDPSLARALDLLKGLAVIQKGHQG